MKLLQLLLFPIFWLLRKLVKLAIVLAIILIIILASGNYWLPWVIKWQIKSRTGFVADIGSSRGSLFKGYLDFHDFSISNPKDVFTTPKFISLNEFAIDIKLGSLLTNAIILEKIIVDIDNITLAKNVDGMYNCQLFMKNMSRESQDNNAAKIDGGKTSNKGTSSEKTSKRVHLGKMVFAIKSVKIVGESAEEHGKEYSLSYRREFSNIDDINAIIKPLMSDLSKYGLSVFIQATFDSILHLPGIGHAVGGLIKVKDISKGIIKDIGGEIKGLFKVEKSGSPSE